MNYRTDIDCLRAFAVMLVIVYHANIGVFTGGFIGVDVFFVISGFLMTNIIVNGLKSDDFNLLSFYGNRTRRVYPALFAFIIVALGVSFLSFMYFHDFAEQIIVSRNVLFGTSNIYFYKNTDYFNIASNLHVFLHTWSLSVEIQFYLLYPIILIGGYRYLKLEIKYIILALFVSSLLLSIYLLRIDAGAAFYLLPARIWEFMVGALAAAYNWTPSSQRLKKLCVGFGFLIIIGSAHVYNNLFHPAFPGEFAILPCLGAFIFICGSHGLDANGLLKRTLFNPGVVFIGLLSYSLYLWHWLVILLYKYLNRVYELELSAFFVCFLSTLILSYFSWRFVEKPFRRSFAKYKVKFQLAAFLTSIALVISFGYALKNSEYITFNEKQKAYLTMPSRSRLPNGQHLFGDKEGNSSFLVIGDSHAKALYEMLDEKAKNEKISGHFVYRYKRLVNTYIEQDEDEEFISYVGPLLEKEKFDTVYFILRWNSYALGPMKTEDGVQKNLMKYKNGKYEYSATSALKAGLEDTMKYLQAKGVKRVYILCTVPENEYFIPQNAALMAISGRSETDINKTLGMSTTQYQCRNRETLAVFADMAKKFDFVKLLDPRPFLMSEDGSGFKVVEDGKSLYRDDDHLSYYGAQKIAPLFTFRP